LDAFWAALVAVFIAELGDKTQLVALSMSTRFNWRVVMAGVFCATLAVHVVSTGLGGVCGELLNDRSWINYLAGLAFIGFGLWTLRGDSLDDDCECKGRSPFWIVACTFFLAELGDKTMLSTAVVAAGGRSSPYGSVPRSGWYSRTGLPCG
jgi:putative Ca2+/H+ antiporter (TMEM165/GDT1 family)